MSDYPKIIARLQQQVTEAKQAGKPIRSYLLKQISVLEKAQAEYLQRAKDKGYTIENSPMVAETILQQTFAMRTLAQEAGLPESTLQKYTREIEEIRIKAMGEDVYESHKNEF